MAEVNIAKAMAAAQKRDELLWSLLNYVELDVEKAWTPQIVKGYVLDSMRRITANYAGDKAIHSCVIDTIGKYAGQNPAFALQLGYCALTGIPEEMVCKQGRELYIAVSQKCEAAWSTAYKNAEEHSSLVLALFSSLQGGVTEKSPKVVKEVNNECISRLICILSDSARVTNWEQAVAQLAQENPRFGIAVVNNVLRRSDDQSGAMKDRAHDLLVRFAVQHSGQFLQAEKDRNTDKLAQLSEAIGMAMCFLPEDQRIQTVKSYIETANRIMNWEAVPGKVRNFFVSTTRTLISCLDSMNSSAAEELCAEVMDLNEKAKSIDPGQFKKHLDVLFPQPAAA